MALLSFLPFFLLFAVYVFLLFLFLFFVFIYRPADFSLPTPNYAQQETDPKYYQSYT